MQYNQSQVTTAKDGHPPSLGWSPTNPLTNPRMVNHSNLLVGGRGGISSIQGYLPSSMKRIKLRPFLPSSAKQPEVYSWTWALAAYSISSIQGYLLTRVIFHPCLSSFWREDKREWKMIGYIKGNSPSTLFFLYEQKWVTNMKFCKRLANLAALLFIVIRGKIRLICHFTLCAFNGR